MDIKSNHRAAGTFIDINTLHIQGVNRKDIAVGFTLRRRSAAITGFTKICTGLNHPIRQRNQPGAESLWEYAGISRQIYHHPMPPAGAGWRIRIKAGHDKAFGSCGYVIPRQVGGNIIPVIPHAVKDVAMPKLIAIAQIVTD